ncbi:MAG: hypothetical protein JWQ07_1662 [Ramlibacter sp.]|nr:hypothetical protein [Ramlibacter sp.]
MSNYNGTPGDDVINQSSLGLADGTNIYGGAGNDAITIAVGNALGQQGNDTLIGTSPWSSAVYWDSPSPIVVNLVTGQVQDGWGTVDTLVNIHVLQLGPGNNSITGSAANDSVWPTGPSSNAMDLGGGSDTVIYYGASSSQATVSYDPATAAFTVVKHFANGVTGTDVLAHVETLRFWGADNIVETLGVADFTGPFRSHQTVAIPGGNGVQQLLEGDFNGDGFGDLWVNRIDGPSTGEVASPVQIVLGDGHGGFTDGTASVFAGAIPSVNYAARVGGADFNGDGITDVFVPDFGADKPPFNGGQNRLFVSAGGKLTDQSAQLEQRLTQGHGLSIGDIDGNGSPDVLVDGLNDPGGKANQVIFSNGAGGFTTNSALFPASVQVVGTYTPGNTWSYIGDLNADGRADIVLGTWEGRTGTPSQLLLASAPGVFPASGVHALPLTGVSSENIVAITGIDLNGDGLRDLVVSATNGGERSQFYQVPYLQFLVNHGGGNFSDETQPRFAQDPADHAGYWYKFVEVVDFNGDGADDILAVTDGSTHSADLLLNDGAGHFTVARTFAGYTSMHAMDVDGDGIPELVGATDSSLTVYSNDIFTGNATGLVFHAGPRADHIAGSAGVDKVVYATPMAQASVSHVADGWTVGNGAFNTDHLSAIERLQFADTKLALDLDGHAGTVARYLGAVFGAASVGNAAYVGIGLSLIDAGMGQDDLMQLALQARLGANIANATLVTTLYTNVVGSAPPAGDLAYYKGLLDSGAYTQAALARMAADTSFNLAHIDLVGLAAHGLAYQ